MHYRSDWPEASLSSAVSEQAQVSVPVGRECDWIQESRVGEFMLRWIFSNDPFESRLYDFPIWSFRLESDWAARSPECPPDMKDAIASSLGQLMVKPRWTPSYLFSRTVESEPLYEALLECGFQRVETRRIYKTRIGDLAKEQAPPDEEITFASLAGIPQEQRGSLCEQMLALCEEAFGEKGYSRHFTDPFLSARKPGRAYIAAAMQLNFERVNPDAILYALDRDQRLCGFSVFGKKTGLASDTFTQLLSAVSRDYRGQKVYRGMTRLLIANLPQDAVLLNATHADNTAMQAAYERSGRVHLADTVVLRKVLLPPSDRDSLNREPQKRQRAKRAAAHQGRNECTDN
jgi:hypothetical protein